MFYFLNYKKNNLKKISIAEELVKKGLVEHKYLAEIYQSFDLSNTKDAGDDNLALLERIKIFKNIRKTSSQAQLVNKIPEYVSLFSAHGMLDTASLMIYDKIKIIQPKPDYIDNASGICLVFILNDDPEKCNEWVSQLNLNSNALELSKAKFYLSLANGKAIKETNLNQLIAYEGFSDRQKNIIVKYYELITNSKKISYWKTPNELNKVSSITANIKTTSGTSPAGSESSFTTDTSSTVIPLNENFKFDSSRVIASKINETNELGGAKSFFLDIGLSTTKSNLSPVIDLDRASVIAVGNRINNVDTSADVYPTTEFVASTEPEGDQNAFIYITKKVALENPATAIKVFFAANRHNTADIEVYFKTLRSDDASDFDDLGYVAFNSDGSPDDTVQPSLVKSDFQQYLYTAGVKDNGEGTSLDEFIAFSIKIVLKGTNSAQPPRVKDLRCIALAM